MNRRMFLKTVIGSTAILTSAALVRLKCIRVGKRNYSKKQKEDELFERIWAATKHWDLDNDGQGYHGMTGDQVRTIIKAINGVA